jgi:hypothetical protein
MPTPAQRNRAKKRIGNLAARNYASRRRRINIGGEVDPNGVTITVQPVSWSGLENQTATFTVVATSGNASTLFYEWQVRNGSWAPTVDAGNVSGSSTATLTVTPVALADNGNQYRVKVTNSVDTEFSNIVSITITGAKFFIVDEDGNRQITETLLNNIMDERTL